MKIIAALGAEARGVFVPPSDLVAQAASAEQDGYGAAWCVHFTQAHDALSVLAAAAVRTSTIELGVGIVPTYPRHPHALAQQAVTVQALSGGRLTLGVGVSHRPLIEGLLGLSYAKPAAHMREYLSVLMPLLRGEPADFNGEFYNVHGGFSVQGSPPPPQVVVGALSPGMVRVAGELTDGIVTWLAGPKSLSEVIVPAAADAALSAGKPAPRIIAGLPMAVTDDLAAAREVTDQAFARYPTLKNYQQLFAVEGVSAVSELALLGSEAEVEAQVRGLAAAGVTELWAIPLPVGADPEGSLRRTRELLLKLG